ncbi:MAG: SDR family oxidoreductase [Anaerolineaceae bacterium]|nr:SDR family oxidoreductase [Anaerolineaceae bacterium]
MTASMEGKVALVTGGSSGIGKATALAFAREGAQVIIASRSQATGEAAVAEIAAAGGKAQWVQTDVSQAAQVQALFDQLISGYGRLDYAFNNGGSGGRGGWLADIEEADWDLTVDGFLKSVFLCMKHELGIMLKAGGGAIVNNSSVDGLRAFPWDPAYSAAKHGVVGLTKSAAMQYASRGVRINAVCPGWILTPPIEEMLARDPGAQERLLTHQPIGRMGRPEEVAEAVLWLCSEGASLMAGVALPVDGGYTAV